MREIRIFLFLLLACAACNPFDGRVSPTIPETTTTPGPSPSIPVQSPTPTLPSPTPESLPTPDSQDLSVVYQKGEQIWLWQANQPIRLTSGMGDFFPRISHDGQIVAFQRQIDAYHSELWAIHLDGSQERRLVSIDDLTTIGVSVLDPNALGVNPYQYEWIPNSRVLAFNTQQTFQGAGQALNDDFNLVDADSIEVKFSLLAGWGGNFSLSPDGKQVALSTPTDITLANLDGSDWRSVLTYDPVLTYSEYRYYAQPVWSPDGRFLYVVFPPADPLAKEPSPTEIWLIPTDNAPPKMLMSLFTLPYFDTPVAFSPDLSQIAYLQEIDTPTENMRELHIARSDGSADIVYTAGELLQFVGWGPPGSQTFVFALGEDQALHLGSLGASPAPLSQATGSACSAHGIFNLRWVDSSRYLYIQGHGESLNLCLGLAGGGTILLDTLPGPPLAYEFALSQSP